MARPDDFPAQPDESTAAPATPLDGLAQALTIERSEAINGRAQTGIETQWQEDEEFYQGIDDANRSSEASTWKTKPPGATTPVVKHTTRSTVFPNITRPYVDAAAARIADMLLPDDDRSWSIKPTPIPDLVDISEGDVPPALQQQLVQLGGDVNALQQQAQQLIDEAKQKADAAQTQIEDWQVEGQFHAEVRHIIEDAARIGTGVLKGPIPVKRRKVALGDPKQGAQQPGILQRIMGGIKSLFGGEQPVTTLIVVEEIKPASVRVDPWNCFPDPSCGENIHNGSFHWERDHLTRKQLQDLDDDALGYISEEIKACLEEGPQHSIAGDNQRDDKRDHSDEKRFEIWYRYGSLTPDQMAAAGYQLEPGDEAKSSFPAMVTMVNDRVIKATLNPLDSGEFPYDYFTWQRKTGLPYGNGVSRQGRTPQRITTAGVRNMMDNAGLAAGGQIVIGTQIVPADGVWELTPRKIWRFAEDANNDDVRKAMAFFEIPSMQKELMEIVQYGMKLMEDATGLPMLLQGQQGTAPDTVGGMTMLFNNASAVLRRLARTYDDQVTEPHVRRYYTWILQHGDESQKGDFSIDARGSTALVERDMQTQHIPEIVKISPNPIYGIDPKKAFSQYLKALRFNVKDWEYDDEEWKKIVTSLQQKPADPRIQVEQIRAQAADQRLTKEQQFEAQQKQADRQIEVLVQSILEHIQAMKTQGAQEINFEQLKAELAQTAMKLRTEDTLNARNAVVDVHKHRVDKAVDLHKHHNPPPVMQPPVQAPGRAANGRAFEQANQ